MLHVNSQTLSYFRSSTHNHSPKQADRGRHMKPSTSCQAEVEQRVLGDDHASLCTMLQTHEALISRRNLSFLTKLSQAKAFRLKRQASSKHDKTKKMLIESLTADGSHLFDSWGTAKVRVSSGSGFAGSVSTLSSSLDNNTRSPAWHVSCKDSSVGFELRPLIPENLLITQEQLKANGCLSHQQISNSTVNFNLTFNHGFAFFPTGCGRQLLSSVSCLGLPLSSSAYVAG